MLQPSMFPEINNPQPFSPPFFRVPNKECEHAGMKKRLARLADLTREQAQTAQEALHLAQDSARRQGWLGVWVVEWFIWLVGFDNVL